jgi:SHS2 domain-containing protein
MRKSVIPKTWGRMTMASCPVPAHDFGEHVGEERLIVRGATLGQVFVEAARGLRELYGALDQPTEDPSWRTIEVDAEDRAALLIEWLNELIYLAESEHWIPTSFAIDAALPTRLRVHARGVRVASAPSQIKAATWHGLRFDCHDGMFEAEVILDV